MTEVQYNSNIKHFIIALLSTLSLSLTPAILKAEVKLYLMVLEKQGKPEKRLEVVQGPLGQYNTQHPLSPQHFDDCGLKHKFTKLKVAPTKFLQGPYLSAHY